MAEGAMPRRGPNDRLSTRLRIGSFVLGVGLVGAGIADAIFNPLAFISADKLLISGGGLIAVAVSGEPRKGK